MSEAPALRDIDEFEGLPIRQICLFVTLCPEGSEDEVRAVDAIRRRAPGIGHNKPPLEAMIAEEIEPLRAKQADFLKVTESAAIVDEESAKKFTDLIAQMRDFERDADTAREKRIRPYLDAQRLINREYNPVIQAVATARAAVTAALTTYDDRRKAAAAEAERKAQEEERRREEEAAAARRRADEAAAAGKSSVADNLAALKAEEEAERAAKRADAVRPPPIRSALGQVTRRREIQIALNEGTGKSDGLRLLLGWMLKVTGGRSTLQEAAMTFVRRHLNALGVDAVEKGVEIPGVTVSVVQGQANVRR